MNKNDLYLNKYLKYKNKYLELINMNNIYKNDLISLNHKNIINLDGGVGGGCKKTIGKRRLSSLDLKIREIKQSKEPLSIKIKNKKKDNLVISDQFLFDGNLQLEFKIIKDPALIVNPESISNKNILDIALLNAISIPFYLNGIMKDYLCIDYEQIPLETQEGGVQKGGEVISVVLLYLLYHIFIPMIFQIWHNICQSLVSELIFSFIKNFLINMGFTGEFENFISKITDTCTHICNQFQELSSQVFNGEIAIIKNFIINMLTALSKLTNFNFLY